MGNSQNTITIASRLGFDPHPLPAFGDVRPREGGTAARRRQVPLGMFIFVATIRAHPDRADRLAEVLGQLSAASRSDAGCREFSFNRDVEDPLVFRSLEVWDSVEQEAAHRETDHEKQALTLVASEGLALGAEMKIYQADLLSTLGG